MRAFVDDYFIEAKRYTYECFDNVHMCHSIGNRYFYNSLEGYRDNPKINMNDYQIPEKCIVNLNKHIGSYKIKDLLLDNFNDIVEKQYPIMRQLDANKWEIITEFLNVYILPT